MSLSLIRRMNWDKGSCSREFALPFPAIFNAYLLTIEFGEGLYCCVAVVLPVPNGPGYVRTWNLGQSDKEIEIRARIWRFDNIPCCTIPVEHIRNGIKCMVGISIPSYRPDI